MYLGKTGGGGGWRDKSRDMYGKGIGSLEGRRGAVMKIKESRGRKAALVMGGE